MVSYARDFGYKPEAKVLQLTLCMGNCLQGYCTVDLEFF